ncbi:hypothetical protein LSAT2_015979 [Lamellibrachia satsuma]|nr:hypothetical protein LSAT2_015979 [Lamellibrachia satsuma]
MLFSAVLRSRNEAETLPRYSSDNFNDADIGEPILDVILEAGDLLYFPRGIIHQGKTMDDAHSLHITVSCCQKNTWGDLMEKLVPRALQVAFEEDLEYRKALPRDYLNYMGVAFSDDDCPERKTFLKKIEQLMKKLLPYMPVDAACDQMSKQFIHDSLPPVITEAERDCSIHGHGEKWDAEGGRVVGTVELDPDTEVKIIRKGVLRLVTEADDVCIYHSLENARVYHGRELQFIDITAELAPGVEYLLHTYPDYATIDSLPLDDESSKMELATILYEKGLLITSRPLQLVSDDNESLVNDGSMEEEKCHGSLFFQCVRPCIIARRAPSYGINMATLESEAGNNTTMTSLTSFWIKFFKDAGIPKVHTEKARENVLKTAENSPKPTRRNVTATASSTSASSNKTAARRIVERYIGNDQICTKSTSDSAVHVSKEMAARLGPSPSQGDTKKPSSVFARLGGTPQRSVESSPGGSPSQGASPVFGTGSGTKRSASSMLGDDEVALPYAGVLKSPETLKKVRLAEAELSQKKLKDTKIVISNEAAVAESRRKPVVTINRLVTSKLQSDIGVLHMDTEGKKSIKERIGGTIVTAATTTTRATKAKTTMAGSHKDLKSRLGQTTDVSSTISVRLGRLRSQTAEVSSSVDTNKTSTLTQKSIGADKKASVFNRLGTAKDI